MKTFRITAPPSREVNLEIPVPASKSISNRLLIIQALSSKDFTIHNLAGAKDTQQLQALLRDLQPDMDAGQGGTTYRFLLAYLAGRSGEWILRASGSMNTRPIGELVLALQNLGADIEYLDKVGYPPVRVRGRELASVDTIKISANVSSQFLSALALIGPTVKGGLKMQITSELVSRPYFEMTLKLLRDFGIDWTWEGEWVEIKEGHYTNPQEEIRVEGDWSSASYWYEVASLAKEFNITLQGLTKSRLQPDCAISRIFKAFGVHSIFKDAETVLYADHAEASNSYKTFDLVNMPDVAQTIAATSSGLRKPCVLEGLQTLRVKETDRQAAMVAELSKLGIGATLIGDHKLVLDDVRELPTQAQFHSHGDHRMAMSLAPLALVMDEITLEDADVVGKSYPDFWEHLQQAGFEIKQ